MVLGTSLYRVSQEESSVFWDAILEVIIKKIHNNMCLIPNG